MKAHGEEWQSIIKLGRQLDSFGGQEHTDTQECKWLSDE
ncbi:hypothetical protein NOR53_1880 [gamma proteobacterium NOR5-3]|nr:hypothetical protein NOR53_1880 [gamma proteobacterium NOR5-3]